MSSETRPISPTRFAEALADLPLDALHSKAAELRNSLIHLKQSNAEMLPFAEAGDDDCREAMFENLAVIGRMNQRIELLKIEVTEKRGMPWVGEDGLMEVNSASGVQNGAPEAQNGAVIGEASHESQAASAPSGRLTDEELTRRLEAQMGEEEEDGVHL